MKHGLKTYVQTGCRCNVCLKGFKNAKHGTHYAFYVAKCRCDVCLKYREDRRAIDDDDERHGTINAYRNLRCRCDLCKRANADAMARYRVARAVKKSNLPRIMKKGA